jgi:acylphosphatase
MSDSSEFVDYFSFRAIAHGRVQGVCYRAFVLEKARQLDIKGVVRNLPTGEDVEVEAEGKKEDLESLLVYLKQGPRLAILENVTVIWKKPGNKYIDFKIVY